MKVIIQECKHCGGSLHLEWEDWVHDRDNSPHCEPEKWQAFVYGNQPFDHYNHAQPYKIELPDDDKILRLLKRAYELSQTT